MTKTNIQIKWILIILGTLICGCAPEAKSAIDALGQRCEHWDESTLRYLADPHKEKMHPQVAALAFVPSNGNLLVAYAFDTPNLPGGLAEIRLSDNHILRSVTLGPLTSRFTRFTEDAMWILSATPKICSDPMFSDKTCWDLQAWHTATGESLEMIKDTNTGLHDVAISGNGRWLLKVKLVNTITNFPQPRSGASFALSYEGLHRAVVVGALSKEGTLVALGIKDESYDGKAVTGSVRLQQWDGKNLRYIGKEGWRIGSQDLTGDGLKLDGVPLRLAFDPSDRWLGAQTASSIYLFDISNFGTLHQRVDFPPSTSGILSFNPSGSLLASGHTQGIRVLSVPELKTVLSKSGVAPTAIAFSPDGCLLAWGDMEGTVHIIPAPMR